MRILLDEQLPRRLAREITGHEARTVQQQGWSGLKNGELMRRAASDGFSVLVTADQNLEFQQNLANAPIGIVVLVAATNALEDVLPLVTGLLLAIEESQPGKVVRVRA